MIKLTYAVYGMNAEADETRLCEALKAQYPEMNISVSYPCSTLTVIREGEVDEKWEEDLRAFCEAQGVSLQLPAVTAKHFTPKPVKRKKSDSVPVSVLIATVSAALVFAILFTFTLTSGYYNDKIRDILSADIGGGDVADGDYATLDTLRNFFKYYSVYELDDEEMMISLLKSYVAATGDPYAVYYTEEELQQLYQDSTGDLVGIGVSVVNTAVPINGVEYNLLTVISVYEDSPASEAGIRHGDILYSIVNDEGETLYVDQLGQTQAINMIRGLEGSQLTLTVLRSEENGTYREHTFTMERRAIKTHSVEYRVCHADSKIGIVKITEFDLTTPKQFQAAMDALIAQDCDKFIFDLRYNGGGDLKSIKAVLSTMLQKGDPIIYTVDKNKNEKVDVVETVTFTDEYAGCSISTEDIGKYRGYDMVVLTNEYTASAAELFTAALRDYDIATQVGVTTFGKGCMQTVLDLSYFGVKGGLRLTTAYYLPPCKESYHDIGIIPKDGEVKLDVALIEKYGNVYLIPDEEDNQLAAAIEAVLSK